jgi:8-oxo-dGTP pyrophosphatase MutT (NUDIX family)
MITNPTFRLRACLAVVQNGKILLTPHYRTEPEDIEWCIPGGGIHFDELLPAAARREFQEETGFLAEITALLDVTEVLLPEKNYHSVTVTFQGIIIGGTLTTERHPRYGDKTPCWFSAEELQEQACHPHDTIFKALKMYVP